MVDVRSRFIQPTAVRLLAAWHRLSIPARLAVVAGPGGLLLGAAAIFALLHQYDLTRAQTSLLTPSYAAPGKIKQTAGAYTYNLQEATAKPAGAGNVAQLVAAASQTDTTGREPYQASLPKNLGDGITFGNASGDLSFKLTPNHGAGIAKLVDGHIIYPAGFGAKHIYTFKRNGIKEDILLNSAPGATASYSWDLDLGGRLEARQLPDGGIGLYSADPMLFSSSLQIGDTKSQALVDKARQAGQKTHLAFVIPAPYLVDATGHRNYRDVAFTLKGSRLTLTAKNLRAKDKRYPLSIDPTVVVTTTADFQTGADDGNIDYSVSGQIGRGVSAPLTAGGWASTSSFSTARQGHATVAYSGYLYIIGGKNAASTYYGDIQYAPINSNGSIGAWNTNPTSFATARSSHTVVVNNGYMYVMGGVHATSDTLCNTSASAYCSDVQYALICTGSNNGVGGCGATPGTVGTWATTTSFNTQRYGQFTTQYNGYVYIAGGYNGGWLTDVQYALFCTGSNNGVGGCGATPGTVGTWATTTNLTSTRAEGSAIAYNGYVYVIGGKNASYSGAVQYAKINADGTLGQWTTAPSLSTARSIHATVLYKGYLYAMGGTNGNYLNDVEYAAINADGSVGTWRSANALLTSIRGSFGAAISNGFLYITGGTTGSVLSSVEYTPIGADGNFGGGWSPLAPLGATRSEGAAVAYNGYFYIIGGKNASFSAAVQYAQLRTDGTLGPWQSSTSIPVARYLLGAVAYNGFLYISGGYHASSDTACNPVASNYCSDVQFAPINGNGSIGAWQATTSMPATRAGHGFVANNGFLYIIGGGGSGYYNDVQYALICTGTNAGVDGCSSTPGTLGSTWHATTSFTNARWRLGATINNGFLYIVGGANGAIYYNDVRYALICTGSNNGVGGCGATPGTVGTWAATTSFATARSTASLVTNNGYFYILGGWNGVTYYSDIQYALICTGSNNGVGGCGATPGTVGTWAATASLPDLRIGLHAVASGDYLYAAAGYNGGWHDDAQSIQISSTGALGTSKAYGNAGSWNNASSFSTARSFQGTVAYNGYMYVAGGYDGSTYYNDIQYAPLQANGTVGAWNTTTSFATARSNASAVTNNGYLYILGGWNGTTYYDDVQYALICTGANNGVGGCGATPGTVGTWAATTSFATARYGHASFAYNGYMYVVGGYDGASQYNDVQYALICTGANNGVGGCGATPGTVGTWNTTTSFTTARYGHASFAYNGYVYVAGGYDGSTYYNDIQYAPLQANGTVGTWATTTSFTTARSNASAVTNNGYLYILGGWNGSTYYNDVQYALICTGANNGVGGCGATPGTVGTWNTTTSFTTARYGHASFAYNGYVYVVGGRHQTSDTACNTSATLYCSDTWFSQLNSMSQIGHYDRILTMGGIGTLASLTFNGQAVCGVGINYRVAGSDGVFGTTNSVPVVLPGVPVAITNPNVRYVWVGFTLDDSVCGTTSTISDITLSYTYAAPDAPTLSSPADANTGQSTTPTFQFRSPQINNSYLQYKLDLCSTSDCSSIVRTIDQTSSQTGWSGQDQQVGTAYTGNATIASSTMASHTYEAPALTAGTQYWWRAYAIDPAYSNTWSAASAIRSFTTVGPPAVPTLVTPAGAATNVPAAPTFAFTATDSNGDYLQYKLDLCSTSDCSSIIATYDQTASQTGWQSQSQQGATAYASGQVAYYVYQGALSAGTQYWWRVYAIDPAGTNVWSGPSAIQTFTTASGPTDNAQIRGGTIIRGGTRI